MPRSLPGPSIFAPSTLTSPEVGVSKPAMILSRVDLPQPEAPIRQTNSPFSISRLASRRASTFSSPIRKVFETPLISRKVLATVLRAPAQDVVVQRDDQAVAGEAGDADDDHAGDGEVGARQVAAVHDHRAEAGRHAGHLADHD